MKQVSAFIVALGLVTFAFGQQPKPQLVTGNSDFVGFFGSPYWPMAQMVEAGPNSFFSIGATNHVTAENQILDGVWSDFANIYFIKYDKNGDTVAANHLWGSYEPINAFSYDGGLTIFGTARENIETPEGDLIIPIDNAGKQEFLVNYQADGKRGQIVRVRQVDYTWDQNSIANMDKRTGAIYVAGTAYQPFNVIGYGMVGEEWEDFLYVIKYGRDLAVQDVYTAGFRAEDGTEYGRFREGTLTISPDNNGHVLVTGLYEGDRLPVFDDETLPQHMYDWGVFALKLDGNLQKKWIKEGAINGTDYTESYEDVTSIFKGLPMKNGDLVLAGMTRTGFFRLGSDSVVFENGSGYSNLFSMRITPEGKVLWIRPLQNMGESFYGYQYKGTASEKFAMEIYQDAIQWQDAVLYMAGTFVSDSFEVAGRILEKKLYEGIFVAAIDLETGVEEWGYAVSSDMASLHGFDLDGAGNVTLMGQTSQNQEFEILGSNSVPGTDLVLQLGLDYNGNPLWYNNAYLEGVSWGCYAADLEVLPGGEVFSSLYASQAYPMSIGGKSLSADYSYTTWMVALDVGNTLGGTVKDKQLNPVFPGYVKAFKSTRSGAYPAVDSTMLDESGVYLFEGLYPGNYVLQVLPDTVMYPEGMPTYFTGAISWDKADVIPVYTYTNTTIANINLSEVAKLNPSDKGRLAGNVSYEDEEGGLKGTKSKPVTRTSVILVRRAARKSTQANNVVAYVITDFVGNFDFNNVSDGDYTLIVDIPGLEMKSSYNVTIQGNQFLGLDFIVGTDEINRSTGSVEVESLTLDRFMVFPNPGSGQVHIHFPDQGDYRVDVFNTVGQLVHSREFPSAAGLVLMDVSELDNGVYFLKIGGNNGSETLKYLKK